MPPMLEYSDDNNFGAQCRQRETKYYVHVVFVCRQSLFN
jgi:hypothetical protein